MQGEKIKESVKKRYAEAIQEDSSCCSSSCCGSTAELPELPKDRVVSSAGYTAEELAQVPRGAVESSFGCGNPLAFAEVTEGQTVLDIGSGAGIDCFIAARKVGRKGNVIGLDMTPQMIERARENARKAGVSNVEFRLGDAEKMPVESGTVDWIISNCVINLSPDKPRVFREAARVLKPGGKVSISDIMVESLPWLLRRSARLYSSCVAGAIPESRYIQFMRDAGFAEVNVTERLVYDGEQLSGLLGEVMPFTKNAFFRKVFHWMIDRWISGKIWSAKITAVKQGSTGTSWNQ